MMSSVKNRFLVLWWAVAAVALGAVVYFFWWSPPVADEPPAQALEQAEMAASGSAAAAVVFSAPPAGRESDREQFFGATTTDQRREEIWRAAMSGGNAEKLGLALEILEAPPSAWTERARQLLQLYVGEDVGDDPVVWRRKIESRQKELSRQRERILEKLERHREKFTSPQ
jgi:hypothetical protein